MNKTLHKEVTKRFKDAYRYRRFLESKSHYHKVTATTMRGIIKEVYYDMPDLKKLAPNVLAYDTDNIKQKFIAEEAWIGMLWSGDAVFTQEENKASRKGEKGRGGSWQTKSLRCLSTSYTALCSCRWARRGA